VLARTDLSWAVPRPTTSHCALSRLPHSSFMLSRLQYNYYDSFRRLLLSEHPCVWRIGLWQHFTARKIILSHRIVWALTLLSSWSHHMPTQRRYSSTVTCLDYISAPPLARAWLTDAAGLAVLLGSLPLVFLPSIINLELLYVPFVTQRTPLRWRHKRRNYRLTVRHVGLTTVRWARALVTRSPTAEPVDVVLPSGEYSSNPSWLSDQ